MLTASGRTFDSSERLMENLAAMKDDSRALQNGDSAEKETQGCLSKSWEWAQG